MKTVLSTALGFAMRYFRLFVIAVAFAAGVTIAYAAEVSTAVDLAPVAIGVLNWAVPLLSAAALWVLHSGLRLVIPYAQSYLGNSAAAFVEQAAISQQDRVNKVLNFALNYGVEKVKAMVGTHGLTIDLKNELLAQAGRYAAAHAPDLLGKMNIQEKLIARLDEHAGVQALAQIEPNPIKAFVGGELLQGEALKPMIQIEDVDAVVRQALRDHTSEQLGKFAQTAAEPKQ